MLLTIIKTASGEVLRKTARSCNTFYTVPTCPGWVLAAVMYHGGETLAVPLFDSRGSVILRRVGSAVDGGRGLLLSRVVGCPTNAPLGIGV